MEIMACIGLSLYFNLLRFNSLSLWDIKTGGTGDLFLRMHKDFKEKSSISRASATGIIYF
jgi:hypothetical protein